MDYHSIVSSNTNKKIIKEIEYYSHENPIFLDYIEYLKKRVDYDVRNVNFVNNLNFFENEPENNNFNMKWNSMKKIPQRLKLQEYVINQLNYSKHISKENIEKNRKKVLDSLYSLLENKQIQEITNTKTKPKNDKLHIKYDISKQQITDILFLKKQKTGLYAVTDSN